MRISKRASLLVPGGDDAASVNEDQHMVKARFIAGFLACAAAGCTPHETDTPPGLQNLIDQRRDLLERMRIEALRPLAEWEAETPPNCGSPRLANARSGVLLAARMLDPDQHGIDAVMEGGTWLLRVADVAQQHGCRGVARGLYDTVVATYTGSAYAALRQRAQISIEDLRQ